MARRKGKKRGPVKGQPKPLKRTLDHNFPVRLRDAMRRRGLVRLNGRPMNSELATLARCTTAAIGQYLDMGKRKKAIDSFLLLSLCDALWVTPYWLALNQGTIEDVDRDKIPMEAQRKRTPV